MRVFSASGVRLCAGNWSKSLCQRHRVGWSGPVRVHDKWRGATTICAKNVTIGSTSRACLAFTANGLAGGAFGGVFPCQPSSGVCIFGHGGTTGLRPIGCAGRAFPADIRTILPRTNLGVQSRRWSPTTRLFSHTGSFRELGSESRRTSTVNTPAARRLGCRAGGELDS